MSQPPEQSTLAVVIPCHNHADTLARAMRSALNQPELDELVVVIDAANDSSLAIAQSFEQDDPRVRVLGLVTQSGPAQARNIGAAAAASEILCFLDADDEHVSGYYRFVKETLASDPRWAGLKSGAQIVDLPDDLSCEDSDPRYSATLGSAPWNLAMRKPLFWLAGGFPAGNTFRGKLGGEDIALNRAFCRCSTSRLRRKNSAATISGQALTSNSICAAPRSWTARSCSRMRSQKNWMAQRPSLSTSMSRAPRLTGHCLR